MPVKKRVIILEAEGGSDKGPDGHRKDTMPIANSLIAKGYETEVMFYKDEDADKIAKKAIETVDCVVRRINPGNIPDETNYCNMMKKIANAGVLLLEHPDTMIAFDSKDALVKLKDTELVPEDTMAYYDMKTLKETFPVNLTHGERVLKQNRGSTGEGIWRVRVTDERKFEPGKPLPMDTKIRCTEAVDNHVEDRQLGEFLDFCNQYLVGDNALLVDMKFLPRIKEGELRILFVGKLPIFVVHKVPAEGAESFSATLFSGAKYRYDPPDAPQYKHLVETFINSLPLLTKRLGIEDIPLIWTGDFILDNGPDGQDAYVLGETNCSCVGFTSHLDRGIQDKVADEIIARIQKKFA